MTCKDIQIMLIERMFGKLAASDRARLEEHLRTCPECLRLARSSPEIPFRGLSDDDIVLPDQEASWRAIWSQTAPGRRKRLSAFRKWAAATAGLAAIFLLGIVAGKRIFFRPGGNAAGPLSAAASAGSTFPSFIEGTEMVLLSALNGSGDEALSKAESRLLGDLLLQTRILKQLIARRNDPQALRLIDDLEMILVGLSNLKAGDRESREFLNRMIEDKDLKFRLKILSGFDIRL